MGHPVLAAPWVQSKGEAYLSLTTAFEDHSGFTATRIDAYGEYGLSDKWTLTAKYEQVDFSDTNIFDRSGARLTARRSLFRTGNWVSAVEAGVLEGEAIGGLGGCEETGIEASLGGGWSGEMVRGPYYIGATLGHRAHDSGCSRNRLEVIAGFENLERNLHYTLQLWSERGDGADSDKIDMRVSRRIGRAEIGVGLREEMSGNFEETAAVVSLALRL